MVPHTIRRIISTVIEQQDHVGQAGFTLAGKGGQAGIDPFRLVPDGNGHNEWAGTKPGREHG
ncbi:hypothetical protein JCM25156A_28480 [Komagataeibacter kakiaceti JCM 25156]